MIMKTIKYTSLFLVLAILLSFSGCKGLAVAGPSLDDETFLYSIIYPADANNEAQMAAKKIKRKIDSNFNLKVNIADDSAESEKNAYEILVGQTNRPESKYGIAPIGENNDKNYNNFIIKVEGKKIIINAHNMKGFEKASNFFIENFCTDQKSWGRLHSQYSFLYAPTDTQYHTIGTKPIRDFAVCLPETYSRIVRIEAENFAKSLKTKSDIDLQIFENNEEIDKYKIKIEYDSSENEYSVLVKNNTLYIKGGTDEALAGAVKKINNLYLEAIKNKQNFTLEEGYQIKESFVASKENYKLVWGDEFNGPELNTKLWVSSGRQGVHESVLGTTAYEMKSEGCFVRDGNAVIWSEHNPVTDNFSSRQISTSGTHIFLYGCMDIRAKLAAAPTANALWFQTQYFSSNDKYSASFQEIDLLEDFGSANHFAANIHVWWNSDSKRGHSAVVDTAKYKNREYILPEGAEPLSDDYHIYSFEWTPAAMKFSVDGKVFLEYDIENNQSGYGVDAFHTPMKLLMSTTLGNATYGARWTRADKDYYESLIDYVRLYQRDIDGGYSIERLKEK